MTAIEGFDQTLLMVIPTVLEEENGTILLDRDFSNNLEAYLAAFEKVVVACPSARKKGSFPSTRILEDLSGHERARIIVLPEPYREDRYVFFRNRISKLLSREIDMARYILISPHAPFDWSTLAASICIRKGRHYNMEADWNVPITSRYIWSEMPFGINKFRKRLWMAYYNPKYWKALKNSSLSLLQGEDVMADYRQVAKNPHSVLNVQITSEDRISAVALKAKVERVCLGQPLQLVYAGRAIAMKGPLYWLETLRLLREAGVPFEARWFGSGEMLAQMERFVGDNNLEQFCKLEGNATRPSVFRAMQEADIFLFCHMSKESPRCLVEALASGAPLVGFGSDYSRGLTNASGGGIFAEPGDSLSLAHVVESLHQDRSRLAELIAAAAESGKGLDRDKEIQRRIGLMKQFL